MPFGSCPVLILLAKSELRTIDVWYESESRVCPPANSCKTDFASSISFGEHQVMAQLIAKSVLISPLINKDFPVRHPRLAHGNFASVNLNHQK
jgi:hypothetical protein